MVGDWFKAGDVSDQSLIAMENKIPTEVMAIQVTKFGVPPVINQVKMPSQMGPTDILVKVEAAGITHFDTTLISGKTGLPVEFPFIPGTDCVGRVVAAGKSAQFLVGKRVVLAGAQGTWSEYIPFNMNGAIPIADDVPVSSAAYGFSNPLTAIGLVETFKVEKKKALVIDAAASALGRMINRIAKREKIGVINVVRKKEHEEILKKEGFDNIIVTEGDWVQKYAALIKATGADCLIDSLGSGDVLNALIKGLPAGGLVLVIGMLNGSKAIVDFSKPGKVQFDKWVLQSWSLPNWFGKIDHQVRKKLVHSHSDRLKTDLWTQAAKSYKFKDIIKAIEASKTENSKGKLLLVP